MHFEAIQIALRRASVDPALDVELGVGARVKEQTFLIWNPAVAGPYAEELQWSVHARGILWSGPEGDNAAGVVDYPEIFPLTHLDKTGGTERKIGRLECNEPPLKTFIVGSKEQNNES